MSRHMLNGGAASGLVDAVIRLICSQGWWDRSEHEMVELDDDRRMYARLLGCCTKPHE